MNFKLKIWRQAGPDAKGFFQEMDLTGVSPDMSFLEMLDMVNEGLITQGKEPIAFDSDCREGICGTCGVVINGYPHGPLPLTTTCQHHMRHLEGMKVLVVEPWRARPFSVIKDLVVDRRALDRIIQAGGYVSVDTASAPEANAIPISKEDADDAFESAACIGCGACVAACPNAAAMLFAGAKTSHLAVLPQGQPERMERALRMVRTMDEMGFGNCTNHGECEKACPAGIDMNRIFRLNADFLKASLRAREPAR